MQIRRLDSADIFDAGKYYAGVGPSPHLIQRLRIDGKIRLVRLPPMPYIKLVDKVGSPRNVTLSNGSGMRQTDTPYAIGKVAWLKSQGFLRYNVCPIQDAEARLHIPESMETRTDFCDPREFGNDPALYKYGDHCACPHMEEVIAIRHGHEKKANEIREEQAKTFENRKLEMEAKRNNAVFEQLAKLTETVAGDAQTGQMLHQISSNPDVMDMLNAMAKQGKKHPDKVSVEIDDDSPATLPDVESTDDIPKVPKGND